MSVPFHVAPTQSQSIDVKRRGAARSYRTIYPQRNSKLRIVRTIERSSDTSDEEQKTPTPQQPKISDVSISMSVPMLPGSGTMKFSSIADFPDIPYSVFSTKCLGEVYNDRIAFKLPANVAKIFCPFDYQRSEEYQILLSIDPPKISIPLNLNGKDFIYRGQEMNISDFLQNGANHFVFNTLNIQIVIVASIHFRMSKNYEYYVRKIVSEYPSLTIAPGAQFVTDKCPIGNYRIEYAARGAGCRHAQCFDLLTFLKRANESGNWQCPVCGLTLSVSSLRYDPDYLKSCAFHMLGNQFDQEDPF